MSYHGRAFGQTIDVSAYNKAQADEQARRAAAPKCTTSQQKAQAVKACSAKTVVKGVGQMQMLAFTIDPFLNIDPCYVANLPLCPPPPPTFKDAPAALYTPPPSEIPHTDEPTATEEEGEPNYALWGGLALLLVAAGGYVAYKATRK